MTSSDPIRTSTGTDWSMSAHRTNHHYRPLLVLLGTVSAVLCLASTAHAAGPQLTVSFSHSPSTVMRGDPGVSLSASVANTGDAPTSGPITATVTIPAGMKLLRTDSVLGCSTAPAAPASAPLVCTSVLSQAMAPGDSLPLISADAYPDRYVFIATDAPSTLTPSVTLSGGGVSDVTEQDVIPVVDRPVFDVLGFGARSLDSGGKDYTVAGGHPYDAVSSFSFPGFTVPAKTQPVEDVRNIWVELPPGFVGAAGAAPRCSLTQVQAGFIAPLCSEATQVGTVSIRLLGNASPGLYKLYNLKPEKGYPAEFAFKYQSNAIVSYAQLRPRGGGYGLNVTVPGVDRFGILSVEFKLFGVPSQRNGTGGPAIPFLSNQSDCLDAQPTTKIHADSWQHPARMRSDGTPDLSDPLWQSSSAPAPAVTGCDNPLLAGQFGPSIKAGPSPDAGSTAADTPSGYQVELSFPQSNDSTDRSTVFDPSVPQAPQLKDATVTLPAGVAISPSAADGLAGCSDVPGDDQVRLDSISPVSCPESSKIGSVAAESPLLASRDPQTDEVTGAESLRGDVFLIKPHPGDLDASGDEDGKFRLLIQIDDPRYGLNVKLPGIAMADKATGRLTARFTDNPQLPVKHLRVTFKSGDRSPLVNPATCGVATTTGVFTPWSRGGTRSDGVVVPGTPDATSSSTFAVDKGANGGACASAAKDLPFAPGFSAGVIDPQAGGSSSFVLRLTRKDGEQELGSIDTVLPAGLLASIRSVARCPEAQAAAGTCDSASQVGTTTVGAGAGASPLFVPQPGKSPTAVYLAGPYKGAPFSLSIVVPAQAGPFDLGDVVVRAAIHVDPIDGHVTVKSDPLPTMRDGVPLRVRDVRVNVDRPGFMLNPTSCSAMAVGADIHSSVGATSHSSASFQVSNCKALGLNPKLDLTLSGKGQTTDGKHPAITANLTQRSGQSNLKKVQVSLPLSLALDPDNANGLCEFVDGSKVEPTCPRSSVVGTATARTPILDQPLSGPVYFVKNIRKDPKSGREIRTLPKLVVPLVGENGVRITLTGTSNVEDDHLVTTFDNIPDAPVSSFALNINGGKHGILTVSDADICTGTQVANQGIEAQNVKQANVDIAIKTPSCPLKVITKKRGKTSVAVKVGGLGAGKVTVSGRGIRKTTKTIVSATVATITAKRTKGTPMKITVAFLPKGAKKAKAIHARLR